MFREKSFEKRHCGKLETSSVPVLNNPSYTKQAGATLPLIDSCDLRTQQAGTTLPLVDLHGLRTQLTSACPTTPSSKTRSDSEVPGETVSYITSSKDLPENADKEAKSGTYSIVSGEVVDITCLEVPPVDNLPDTIGPISTLSNKQAEITGLDTTSEGLKLESTCSDGSYGDFVESGTYQLENGGFQLKEGVDGTAFTQRLKKLALREILEGRHWSQDRRHQCTAPGCRGIYTYNHGVFRSRNTNDSPPSLSVDEARSRAEPMSKKIWENFHRLRTIISRYEMVIQRRWAKKSKNKRKQTLRLAWASTSDPPPPPIAEKHRPEVHYLRETKHTPEKEGYSFCRNPVEEDKRHLFFWPRVNLEDLSQLEPLLLLLNARGRHSPPTFAFADLEPVHFGLRIDRLSHPPYLDMYNMVLTGQEGPETYGQLVSWEEDPTAYRRLHMGRDTSPGEGLWILEIQDRLYRFLVNVCEDILHDQLDDDYSHLLALPVAPEPPLPTANGQANASAMSLLTTRNEIAYHLPAKLDIRRLQNLIASKLAEAEDTLWALREDPSFFAMTLENVYQSRPEQLRDTANRPHPLVATPEGRLKFMPYIVRFMWTIYVPAVDRWGFLHDMVSRLAELKEQLFDKADPPIRPEDDLPPELSMAIYSLLTHLNSLTEDSLHHVLCRARPSPPLRDFYRRKLDFNLKLAQNRPLASCADVILSGVPFPREVAYYTWVLGRMSPSKGDGVGLHDCVEELERINRSTAGHKLTSTLQAAELSDFTIVSECIRQLELFQPWAATFEAGRTDRITAQKLKEEAEETDRVQKPFVQWTPSRGACTLGAKLAHMPYPVDKPPTEANIAAMRLAEGYLDDFWVAAMAELETRNLLTDRVSKILLHASPERTPIWVEPAKTKVQATQKNNDQLPSPFQCGPDDTQAASTKFRPAEPRIKVKSRGVARPPVVEPGNGEAPGEAAPATGSTFDVDERTMKVIDMLFYTHRPGAPQGEVPWTEFTYMMHHVGFGVEKLMGSAWQFTPGPELIEHGCTRGIQCHEPHPSSKLPFTHARRFGRRLTRTYGWCVETFRVRGG